MTEQRFVHPEVVTSHFHLRPGDTVGDFGAGAGHFTAALSRAVGHAGKIYAVEIQKNLAETLKERARREHLGNVEVLWGDIEEVNGTKLEDGILDAALIVNTMFQLDDRDTAAREIHRALRAGGKLLVIDWSESWGGLGPQPGHVLNENEAKAVFETAGFTFERDFDAGGHHYGLAFRK